MSVAANPTTEQAPPNVQQRFAFNSAVGAVLVLLGLAIIFGALPLYWSQGWEAIWASAPELQRNLFLSDALLILLEIAVVGGLAFVAYYMLQQQTQPGVRAGMFIGALYLFLSL